MTLVRTNESINRTPERRTDKSSLRMLCGGTSKWRWPWVPPNADFPVTFPNGATGVGTTGWDGMKPSVTV